MLSLIPALEFLRNKNTPTSVFWSQDLSGSQIHHVEGCFFNHIMLKSITRILKRPYKAPLISLLALNCLRPYLEEVKKYKHSSQG